MQSKERDQEIRKVAGGERGLEIGDSSARTEEGRKEGEAFVS